MLDEKNCEMVILGEGSLTTVNNDEGNGAVMVKLEMCTFVIQWVEGG